MAFALAALGATVAKEKGWPYLLLLALAVPLGAYLSHRALEPPLSPRHIARLGPQGVEAVQGVITASPRRRGPDKTVILLQVEALLREGRWQRAEGRVRLTVRGNPGLRYGHRIRTPAKLRRPRNFYNPGSFDYEAYLARRGIFVTGYIRDPEAIEVLGRDGGHPILRFVDSLRGRLEEVLRLYAPREAEGVLRALLLGQRDGLSKEVKDSLRKTGTYHLLAISGLHIGIVTGLLFLLLQRVLMASETLLSKGHVRRFAGILSLPVVGLYVLLVGAPLSAIRAGIMVAVPAVALILGRGRTILNALSLAALLILLLWPGSLWEPSFQLSFSAVGGILLLAPALLRGAGRDPLEWLRGRPWSRRAARGALAILVISLCAQIATYPISLHLFHLVSTVGLAANLLAIPLIGFVALPLGFLSLPLALIYPPLASPLLALGSFVILGVLEGLKALASWPGSHLYLPGPTFLEASIFYALCATFIWWRRIPRKGPILVGLCLLLCIDGLWWHLRTRPKGTLEVVFLDAGQGDAAFLRLPEGQRILIDGGGFPWSDFDVGERVIAPFLWERRALRIDYLVLSHPQPDHYRGLIFIAKYFRPREFWYNGRRPPYPDYLELLEALRERGVRCLKVGEGFRRSISGVSFEVLHPPPGYRSNLNDSSLVLRLKWRGRSVLFTGDIGANGESHLLKGDHDLRTEVLKVPHHGSKTSSTYPFVQEVRPLYAVISVGRGNPFGHPTERVLRRYEGMGAVVLRTDLHGAITLVGDEEGWSLRTFLKGSASR